MELHAFDTCFCCSLLKCKEPVCTSPSSPRLEASNMYYPPVHPSDFITKVFLDFSEIQSDIAIVGGDFNCILNPLIDKLPSKAMSLSPQAKALHSICEDLGFVDVWRTIHTSDKAYTFFSAPHGSHSRIDYFFMSGLEIGRAS